MVATLQANSTTLQPMGFWPNGSPPPERDIRLSELAREMNNDYDKVVTALRKGLHHACCIGRMLEEVKELLQHGEWSTWIEKYCKFSLREAQRFIRIAAHWDEIQARCPHMSRLTLTQALDIIAEPREEANNGSGAQEQLAFDSANSAVDTEEPAAEDTGSPELLEPLASPEERAQRAVKMARNPAESTGDATPDEEYSADDAGGEEDFNEVDMDVAPVTAAADDTDRAARYRRITQRVELTEEDQRHVDCADRYAASFIDRIVDTARRIAAEASSEADGLDRDLVAGLLLAKAQQDLDPLALLGDDSIN